VVGIEVSPEFAPMFPRGRQRVRFNRVIQLDQLSTERRQSRTAAAVPPVAASIRGKRKKNEELFRSSISSRARR
jgi:hypothetical protein